MVGVLVVVIALTQALDAHEVPAARAAAAGLVERAPILITGNEGFTLGNGVSSGTGTHDDPYIIEGWEINASSAHGIRIQDTTSYFVVRNVHVFDGRYFVDDFDANDGISLNNVTNARIQNVTAERCRYGVWVLSSGNAVVTGSHISFNNFSGIGFSSSEHVSASANLVSDNIGTELWMGFCKNSTINDNTVRDSNLGQFRVAGIDVWRSENVSVIGNYMDGNRDSIFLETSSNCMISGNTIVNDMGYAIYVYYSGNSTFLLNDVSSAVFSVAVQESSNNTFFHNNFRSGIFFYGAGTNKFDNGYPCGGNFWDWSVGEDLCNGAEQDVVGPDGIADQPFYLGSGSVDRYAFIRPLHPVIAIDGNDEFTSQNGVIGGFGTEESPYAIDSWLIDTSLAPSDTAGISISNTDAHFLIRDVIIRSGGILVPCIRLANVSNGSISESLLVDNYAGIVLNSTRDIAITENQVLRNAFAGILVNQSDGAVVTRNAVSNSSYGIRIVSSPNCSVEKNIVRNNSCGIYVNESAPTRVKDNTFGGNAVDIISDEKLSSGGINWYLVASTILIVIFGVVIWIWMRKHRSPPSCSP